MPGDGEGRRPAVQSGCPCAPVAAAGRWDSEAKADRYANPLPGWKFFLPDDVPWPAAEFTCPTKSGRWERWAPKRWQDKRMVPQMSAPATVMTKGPVFAPAPTCTSPSYWAPLMTSRPTQWFAGSLGNPKVSADEDVGPQPRQLNDRAHSPPVVRGNHARPLA